MHTDHFDRAAKDDLLFVHFMALFGKACDDIADIDRAIQLTSVRRSTDENDFSAINLSSSGFCNRAAFSIFCFQTFAIGFEDLFIGFVCSQGLLLWKQEVAGIAVFYSDNIADGAKLFDPFKEDNIHLFSPLTSRDTAASRFDVNV